MAHVTELHTSELDQYGNPLLGLTLSESRSREVGPQDASRVLQLLACLATHHSLCDAACGAQACLAREAGTAFKWRSPDVDLWAFAPGGPLAPKRVKLLARDGIPAALRPRLWFRFSGGASMQASHRGHEGHTSTVHAAGAR